MSYVDSSATFRQRCLAIELPADVIQVLSDRGWATFANFAHAPKVMPGQQGAEAALQVVLDSVLGAQFGAHEAALRRLHWESWTLTAADLKKKLDSAEDVAPRKLPVAEIGARLTILAPKLSPLKLQGVLEPSHAAINIFAQMLDENRLRYVEWHKLTTRTQEVNSTTEDPMLKAWKPDKNGVVREVMAPNHLRATVASELDVHNALRRRGVCYAIARLMSLRPMSP